MQITNLDEEAVLKQARQDFKGMEAEIGTTDLYVQDIESGNIRIDGIDHDLYVSTHYAYEDHIVNNNKTRYKLHITSILLREDPYEVIYDSKGKFYIAYEEDGIHFVLYEEFQAFLKPHLHEI